MRRELLAWFRTARRALPWRDHESPYAVWVSELMLQQTQVATVIPYFERWMERFPTVYALADASEDAVLQAWQGLGYYKRARALRLGARRIVDEFQGEVPSGVAELRSLPGVGPYAAGAIASIAHGVPTPLVDGNVERVLCRLFALRGDPTKAPVKKRIWELATGLVPATNPGMFNQALMELGSLVCRPRAPECARCPVARHCAAHAAGTEEALPELPKRPDATPLHMAAAVVFDEKRRVLLVQRSSDATRWAGLWDFPTVELQGDESAERAAARAARERGGESLARLTWLVRVKHSVTRFRVTLDAFASERAQRSRASGPAERSEPRAWVSLEELADLAMSAPQRKVARHLFERERERDRCPASPSPEDSARTIAD